MLCIFSCVKELVETCMEPAPPRFFKSTEEILQRFKAISTARNLERPQIYITDAAGSICKGEYNGKQFSEVLDMEGVIAGISKVIYQSIREKQISENLAYLQPGESTVIEYPNFTESGEPLLLCHTRGPDARNGMSEEDFITTLKSAYMSCLGKTGENATNPDYLQGLFNISGATFAGRFTQKKNLRIGSNELCVSYLLHCLSSALFKVPGIKAANIAILIDPFLIMVSKRMVYELEKSPEPDFSIQQMLAIEKELLTKHMKMMDALSKKTKPKNLGKITMKAVAQNLSDVEYKEPTIKQIQAAIENGLYSFQLPGIPYEVRFGINAYSEKFSPNDEVLIIQVNTQNGNTRRIVIS